MSVQKRGRKQKFMEARIEDTTQSTKTINDIPPEVLEIILKKLGCGKNSVLPYRLVHSSWKVLIDDHLEKKNLKGDPVGCSKAFIVGRYLRECPPPRIRVPEDILYHRGNPFPSRSLFVTPKECDERGEKDGGVSLTYLDIFMTKFGSHLNYFELDGVHLKFGTLIKILSPLVNLKILKLSRLYVELFWEDDLNSFPILPHLTTLEQRFLFVSDDEYSTERENQFFAKLIETYSDHLVSLGIGPDENYLSIKQHRRSVENCRFKKLEQLNIYNPTEIFLSLSCIPLLKRLTIMRTSKDAGAKIDVLMSFANKFCETLESLEIDIPWDEAFSPDIQKRVSEMNCILKARSVVFPKLTKFSLHYPTHEREAVIIKIDFLVKFPALRVLHLINFKFARDFDLLTDNKRKKYGKKADNDKIKKDLLRHNYSDKSTTLNRISVWFLGGEYWTAACEDNYLVYSMDTARVQTRDFQLHRKSCLHLKLTMEN